MNPSGARRNGLSRLLHYRQGLALHPCIRNENSLRKHLIRIILPVHHLPVIQPIKSTTSVCRCLNLIASTPLATPPQPCQHHRHPIWRRRQKYQKQRRGFNTFLNHLEFEKQFDNHRFGGVYGRVSCGGLRLEPPCPCK